MKTIIAGAVLAIASLSACAAQSIGSPPAQRAVSDASEECAAFSPTTEDFMGLPSLRIGRLSQDEAFALPAEAPEDTSFIRCQRDNLLPLPSDYKVVVAGYPLIIAAGDRVAALEISDGKLHFRALTGKFTDEETPLILAYLDQSSTRINASRQ